MDKIINFLYTCPKWILFLLAFFLILLIGFVDYLSGLEISVSLLYLVPIGLISWCIGERSGVLVSLMATVDWFLADWFGMHIYSHPAIPYWNALVELTFFSITSYAISGLRNTFEKEKNLSRKDTLTNISNRRAFFETANLELERSLRYKHPLSLAYIDLDNFKMVNDGLGHQVGDKVLILVAQMLEEKTRLNDTVARLGGDEFAVLLPEANLDAAKIVIEKLQQDLLKKMQENNWPITFSIGTVSFQSPPSSINELIHEADLLMYEVKKSGKNKIYCKFIVDKNA